MERMASFNVLTEPWIPVMELNGTIRETGIIQLLAQAPGLKEIYEPSPLMKYGIHRLLTAFLTDALRPERDADLSELASLGCFPMERILEYVAESEKDGPCFDLFDRERPFLQCPYSESLDSSKMTSVAKLLHHLPSGNNAVHFEHSFQDEQAFSAAICTRALTAVNVFCTSGLQGPSGMNGAPPWYLIIVGETLFDTLLYNLWLPGEGMPFNRPAVAWRNHSEVIPNHEIEHTSYLYGLTWPARRVCLVPGTGEGRCTYTGIQSDRIVKDIYFQAGLKFVGHHQWRDPFVAYLITREGRVSLKPRENREAWRDLGALLFNHSGVLGDEVIQTEPPAIIEQYHRMIRNGLWERQTIFRIELFGLVTDKAAYEEWLHDRFAIDPRVAADMQKSAWLGGALGQAEQINKSLRRALQRIQPQHGKVKAIQKRCCADLIDQAEFQFFTAIRIRFFEELLPRVADTDISEWDRQQELDRFWRGVLALEAQAVLDRIVEGIGHSARNLERGVIAEKVLVGDLDRLLKGGDGDNRGDAYQEVYQ